MGSELTAEDAKHEEEEEDRKQNVPRTLTSPMHRNRLPSHLNKEFE